MKLWRSALHILGGQRESDISVCLVDADTPIHETTDIFIEEF